MPDDKKRLIPVAVIATAVILFGFYFLYQTYWQDAQQVYTGTLEARETHLGIAAGGTVEEVYVEEGDAVQLDQLLAFIDSAAGGSADRVRSPIDGVVMLRAAEPGEVIAAGGTLLVVANLDQMTLTIYVPEDQYGKIHLGEQYPISVDSYPERVFMGTVTHIADEAEFTPQNIRTAEGRKNTVYAVRLTVPNPDHDLKPGMPADVALDLE